MYSKLKRKRLFQVGEQPLKEQFDVILDHGQVAPHCVHGPCLLFERKSGKQERFFACAVYRSKDCTFYRRFQPELVARSSSISDSALNLPSHKRLRQQFLRSFKSTDKPTTYCRSCEKFILNIHGHFETGHDLVKSVTIAQTFRPSQFLTALTNSNGEAYWFDSNTVKVILSLIVENDFDGVLCIGAPTIFEQIRVNKIRSRVFLLDFDRRFMPFLKMTEFAQYSMLVDYFYDINGQKCCDDFLKNCEKLLIVADPPFGVMLKPFFESLSKMRQRYRHYGSNECQIIVALPYFLEKLAKKFDQHLEMVDYVLTYSNHPHFMAGRSSPIRFFTTIPLELFVLPAESGYRFCSLCVRYVSHENRHCSICDVCPSKNGRPYKHCDKCSKCFKSTYKHCPSCRRCHLVGKCANIVDPKLKRLVIKTNTAFECSTRV